MNSELHRDKRPMMFAFCALALFCFSPSLYAQTDDEYAGDEYAGDMYVDEEITFVGTVETTQQMEVISREEIEKAHAPDIPALL